ncbi:MAG: restriction endonuclease [Dehalococcoidia bacterium]
MPELTLIRLKAEARQFAFALRAKPIPELFGITDGKAVGTYVELELHEYLRQNYNYTPGSAASGADFPHLEVDVKATSIRQPQSSSHYRSASQKVYGLGHHLLVFVYNKIDDPSSSTASLDVQQAIFVAKEQTGDYQTTYGLNEILRRYGNRDDVIAFLEERNLPLDEIGREQLADQILQEPPEIGYLTISNALQWRLQFRRVITTASSGEVTGVENLLA